jgi:hypothetical protein
MGSSVAVLPFFLLYMLISASKLCVMVCVHLFDFVLAVGRR